MSGLRPGGITVLLFDGYEPEYVLLWLRLFSLSIVLFLLVYLYFEAKLVWLSRIPTWFCAGTCLFGSNCLVV